jgi:DNA-binding MarR family transcriptional regulator
MDPAVPYLPSLGRLLGFASKSCSDLAEKRLAQHDLTLQQWVLLTALWRRDGLTVGQLATYYRATEPSTSNLVGRMETKGLVRRELNPEDRRQVRVLLNEKGRSLSHLLGFYEEINEILLQGFTADERKALVAMLERVLANADVGKER